MRDALDPDTEYQVIKSETSISNDGLRKGEPTGEIRCEGCGQSAENIDEIPHEPDCSQRFSKTGYWRDRFLSD